jgi:NADH:ubiquinone oxidoreductase subunit C
MSVDEKEAKETRVTNEEILAALKESFPQAIVAVPAEVKDFTLVVSDEHLVEVAAYLRDEAGFDYLSCLTATDQAEYFELVYYLYSMEEKTGPLVLKVRVPDKENPEAPSLVAVWRGAEFQECEVYDFFGIRFTDHPDLRRLFLWEGFEGWPLRKDFEPAWPVDTNELVALKHSKPQDII